jgi:hypothetical protein
MRPNPRSAVVISQNLFHGNFPNTGAWPRRMLAIAYRPEQPWTLKSC